MSIDLAKKIIENSISSSPSFVPYSSSVSTKSGTTSSSPIIDENTEDIQIRMKAKSVAKKSIEESKASAKVSKLSATTPAQEKYTSKTTNALGYAPAILSPELRSGLRQAEGELYELAKGWISQKIQEDIEMTPAERLKRNWELFPKIITGTASLAAKIPGFLGRQLASGAFSAIESRTGERAEWTPKTGIEKFFFGEETIKSFRERYNDTNEIWASLGANNQEAKTLGILGVGLSTYLDMIPGIDDTIKNRISSIIKKEMLGAATGQTEKEIINELSDQIELHVAELSKIPNAVERKKRFEEIMDGYKDYIIRRSVSSTDDLANISTELKTSIPSKTEELAKEVENIKLSNKKSFDELEPGFEISEETKFGYLQRQLQNKLNRLKIIQEQIEEQTGKKILDGLDVYLKANLYIGKAKSRLDSFSRNSLDPLLKKIKSSKIDIDELGTYLYAKHAAERNAKIFEDFNKKNGSGLSDLEAKKILEEFEKENKTKILEDLSQDFYSKITSKRLEILKDSGLISEETYRNVKSRYQFYTPLKGKEGLGDIRLRGQGFSLSGKDIKRAKGRSSLAKNNPFTQAILDYEDAIVRSEKNEVGKTLLKLVEENPNKDLWEVENLRYSPVYNEAGELQYLDPKFKFSDNILQVVDNGKIKLITIKDKQLADAMKNLGVERAYKFLTVANNYLRNINTVLYPEFIITNFERDIQTAALNITAEQGIKMAKNVVMDVPSAMKGIYKFLRKDGDSISKEVVDETTTSIQQAKASGKSFDEWVRGRGYFDGDQIAKEAEQLGSDQGGLSDFTLNKIKQEIYSQQDVSIKDLRKSDIDLDNYLKNSEIREYVGEPFAMDPIVTSGGEVLDGYNRIAQMIKNGEESIIILKGEIPSKLKSQWDSISDEAVSKDNIKKNVNWSKLYQDLQDAGGKVGWIDSKSIEEKELELIKKINLYNADTVPKKFASVINSIAKFAEGTNEIVESAVRLSAFKNAIDNGISTERAAYLAKNLTVDFNKKGNIGVALNSAYLFANAGIQGSARILTALKTRRGRQIAAGIVAFSYGLAEANKAINSEAYEAIPEGIKDQNLIFMTPSGNYIKIKLPWGYNVFKILGDVSNDMVHGDTESSEAMKRLLLSINNSFNPLGSSTLLQSISPTLSDPLVQLEENKNWFGTSIMPEVSSYAPEKKDSSRYFSTVRESSKDITDWLNKLTGGNNIEAGFIDISPETVDHIIDFIAGGTGRFIANTYEFGSALTNKDFPPVENIPFVRQLIGSPSEYYHTGILNDYINNRKIELYDSDAIEEFREAMAHEVQNGNLDIEEAEKMFNTFYSAQEDLKLNRIIQEEDTEKRRDMARELSNEELKRLEELWQKSFEDENKE